MIGDTRGVMIASQKVSGASGPTGTISSFSSERAMSSHPSGSTTTISASGTASAMPDASPPPPQGMTIRAGGRPSCSTISSPAVPCPATIAGSSKLGTTVAPRLVCDPRRDRLAALGTPVVEDDLRAFSARALDLHLRRIRGHDDDRPNAEPAGRDSHAARVISRRESDDAPLPLLRRELEQAVGRAPQLECAAGLQALAFQPGSHTIDVRFRSTAFARRRRRSAEPQPLHHRE